MLVRYKESLQEYPVGIVVAQWKIGSEIRMYVIYPIQKEIEEYVEVEVVTEPEAVVVISSADKSWQDLGDTFGDNSEGYPCGEATQQDLYTVWDEGSGQFHEASVRIFQSYRSLISKYTQEAVRYLDQYNEQRYDVALSEARKNAWDINIINKLPKSSFPYVEYAKSDHS